jgi:hypothetical protein
LNGTAREVGEKGPMECSEREAERVGEGGKIVVNATLSVREVCLQTPFYCLCPPLHSSPSLCYICSTTFSS